VIATSLTVLSRFGASMTSPSPGADGEVRRAGRQTCHTRVTPHRLSDEADATPNITPSPAGRSRRENSHIEVRFGRVGFADNAYFFSASVQFRRK
jgi:hypothetical protein